LGQLQTRSEASLMSRDDLLRHAKDMQSAKLLPDGMTVQEAFICGQKGQEMGIPPTEAMTKIYIILGKPQLKSELILELACKRIPGFAHSILEYSNNCVTVEYLRNGRQPFKLTWTMEKARQTGVCFDGKGNMKDQWVKRPDEMLFNRNVSEAMRIFAPDYKSDVMFDFDEEESKESRKMILAEEANKMVLADKPRSMPEVAHDVSHLEVGVETPSTISSVEVEAPLASEYVPSSPSPTSAEPPDTNQVIDIGPPAKISKIDEIKETLLSLNNNDQKQAEEHLQALTVYTTSDGKENKVNTFDALSKISEKWLFRVHKTVMEAK